MRSPLLVLLASWGCGGASGAPAVSAPVTPPPDPAVDAAPLDAAAPVARLDSVIVAGALTASDAAAVVSAVSSGLAACLSADGVARATEVSLLIDRRGRTELRTAWQGGVEVAVPCLTAVLGDRDAVQLDDPDDFTMVYLVVLSGPPGVSPPAAPPPPDRRADVQTLFCDLLTRSGASQAPFEARQDVAIAWARAHVRHPNALVIAARVPLWSPAERTWELARAVKAEGITQCADREL